MLAVQSMTQFSRATYRHSAPLSGPQKLFMFAILYPLRSWFKSDLCDVQTKTGAKANC